MINHQANDSVNLLIRPVKVNPTTSTLVYAERTWLTTHMTHESGLFWQCHCHASYSLQVTTTDFSWSSQGQFRQFNFERILCGAGCMYACKRGSAESKKAKATCVGGLHDSLLQSPPHCHAKPHGWRQLSCFLIQISETRRYFLSNSQLRFLWAPFHLYHRRDVTHLSLP